MRPLRGASRAWSIASAITLVISVLSTPQPVTSQEADPVPDVVDRHAPLVYLHPSEEHRPYSADDYFQRSVPPIPDADVDGGFYLDAPEGIRGGVSPDQAPAYYEYEPRAYIIYWFFYAFDEQRLGEDQLTTVKAHQGDWEHIVIRLDEKDEPTHIAYYQHECNPTLYESEELSGHEPFGSWTGFWDGTHPIVYSALGSHASYPGPRRRGEPFGNDCKDLRTALADLLPGPVDDFLIDALSGRVSATVDRYLPDLIEPRVRAEIHRLEGLVESYRWDAAQRSTDLKQPMVWMPCADSTPIRPPVPRRSGQ